MNLMAAAAPFALLSLVVQPLSAQVARPLPAQVAQSLATQQAVTLRGRVADASDVPVAGAVVLLHAIGEDAGRELDRDTADAAGAFELSFAFEAGPLYFVATRVDGDIFMADPFREPPAQALVLRAGAGVEPLRVDGRTPGPPIGSRVAGPSTDDARGALLWVVLIGAAVVALVLLVVARGRRRAPRARELMLEIARLDEANGNGMMAEATYRTRRDELRAGLVEALELDPDADRH